MDFLIPDKILDKMQLSNLLASDGWFLDPITGTKMEEKKRINNGMQASISVGLHG